MQQEAESVRPTRSWGGRFVSILGWLAILYLVIAAVLAFVVPDFARNVLQQKLSPDPFVAQIDKLRINPLKLAVEIDGFHLTEGRPANGNENTDSELLYFQQLRIDISPWALSKRAIGFDEIALIEPRVGVHLNRQQQLNWQRYGDSLQASLATEGGVEADAENAADDELPRVMVSQLLVDGIDVHFSDASKPGTFEAEFGPTTIEVQNLSTLVGDNASYAISAVTERSELVAWNGDVRLNPLRSTGAVAVSGWRLPLVWQYFKDQLKFEVADGAASLSGRYIYDGNLTFADGILKLDNIVVQDRTAGNAELIALPTTAVSGIAFDLDRQRLDIAAVDIAGLKVRERIDPQGVSMLASVLAPHGTAASGAKATSGAQQSGQSAPGKTAEPAVPAAEPGDAATGQAAAEKPRPQEDLQSGSTKAAPVGPEEVDPRPDPSPASPKPVDTLPVDTVKPATPVTQEQAPEKPAAAGATPEVEVSSEGWQLRLSLISEAGASTPAETTAKPAVPGDSAPPPAANTNQPAPMPTPTSGTPERSGQSATASALEPDTKGNKQTASSTSDSTTAAEEPGAVGAATASNPASGGSDTFSVGVGRLALTDAAVTVQHQLSASVDNTIELQDIDIEVTGFEFPSGEIQGFTLDTRVNKAGKLALQGSGDIDPLEADFKLELEGFELAALMPYIEPLLAIKLESGSMAATLDGTVAQRGEQLDSKVSGQLNFKQILVNEAQKGSKVLSFEGLNLNDLAWDSGSSALQIDQVELLKPFAKIVIFKEGGTNLSELVVEGSQPAEDVDSGGGPAAAAKPAADDKAKPAADDAGKPVSVAIRSIDFHEGTADFADLSLPRTFRAAIYNIKGSVKGLDTDASAAAVIDLEGQVEKYAPVTLKGKVKPLSENLSADIELIFRNLELTSVSPYSDTYAGYNIDKGKLTADFRYQIADQKLTAENQLVIDQLTLGERTDSATATSLPVALAVALLKDSNGVIDLNLPVSGDLDDPEFHYGALIGKALLNLVTKIVTAPFALLGSLVGEDAEDLDHVAFGSGDSEFTAVQMSKLTKVAEALAQRPQLAVSLRGVAAPAVDTPVLKQQRLEAALAEQGIEYPVTAGSRKEFIAWFEKSTGQDVDSLRKELEASQPNVEKKALEAQVQERLLESMLRRQKVGQSELGQLARARSEQVREALVEAGVDPARLFILDPEISSEKNAQPTCKLELEAS